MTEDRVEEFAGSQPFADLIGVEVTSVTADRVVAHLEWAPERCTSGAMLHGGAMMSLADAVGGLIAFINLPAGATGTTTVSSSTQFTRGLRQGRATATARPLHVGRTTIVVETDVRDDDDRLLVRVTQTQAVLTG